MGGNIGCMDGQMDDGQMNGWMDRLIFDPKMGGQMDEQKNKQIFRWVETLIDGQKDGQTIDRLVSRWMNDR